MKYKDTMFGKFEAYRKLDRDNEVIVNRKFLRNIFNRLWSDF